MDGTGLKGDETCHLALLATLFHKDIFENFNCQLLQRLFLRSSLEIFVFSTLNCLKFRFQTFLVLGKFTVIL